MGQPNILLTLNAVTWIMVANLLSDKATQKIKRNILLFVKSDMRLQSFVWSFQSWELLFSSACEEISQWWSR